MRAQGISSTLSISVALPGRGLCDTKRKYQRVDVTVTADKSGVRVAAEGTRTTIALDRKIEFGWSTRIGFPALQARAGELAKQGYRVSADTVRLAAAQPGTAALFCGSELAAVCGLTPSAGPAPAWPMLQHLYGAPELFLLAEPKVFVTLDDVSPDCMPVAGF